MGPSVYLELLHFLSHLHLQTYEVGRKDIIMPPFGMRKLELRSLNGFSKLGSSTDRIGIQVSCFLVLLGSLASALLPPMRSQELRCPVSWMAPYFGDGCQKEMFDCFLQLESIST